MIEKENNSANINKKEITIPQVSDALADLFKGQDIESEDLLRAIEEINNLINAIITKLPQNLKHQLLMGPNSEREIHYFIENVKEEASNFAGLDNTATEILDNYLEFFERGGEGCLKKWREIVRTYNPNRAKELINGCSVRVKKREQIEKGRETISKKYHPDKF